MISLLHIAIACIALFSLSFADTSVVNVDYTVFFSSLQEQTWNNLVINQLLSSSDAKSNWQRTSSFLPYNASAGFMQLLPTMSSLDNPNAGYWTEVPVPKLSPNCTQRRITVVVAMKYPPSTNLNLTQHYEGLTTRVGFSSDAMTQLEFSGLAYGVYTGIDNTSFMYPNCDFVNPGFTMGLTTMGQVCDCDLDSRFCLFFKRFDIPSVRSGNYFGVYEVAIDVSTGLMSTYYTGIADDLTQTTFFQFSSLVLNLIPVPYNQTAARWLNQNGTVNLPMIFLDSQYTVTHITTFNITVIDNCTVPPVLTSPAPAATTLPVIVSSPSTLATSFVAISSTLSTLSTASDGSTNGTTSATTTMGENVTANGNATEAPIRLSPNSLEEFGTTNILIVAVVFVVAICAFSCVCIFRERITSSRWFAKLYASTPASYYLCFCCRPMQATCK